MWDANLYLDILQMLIKGLIVGIAASAPMGPVGLLCIRRTLQKGRAYGLVTGAGAATSDFLYAVATGAGMTFVFAILEDERYVFWLKLLGCAMLVIFGWWMLRSDPTKGFRPQSNQQKGTLWNNFFTSFLITLSNPLIIFLFLAVFNMLTFYSQHWIAMLVGYLSIIPGALIWWYGLTYILSKMKSNFGIRGVVRLNRTIGYIVLAIAAIYAILTIFNLSLY